MEDTAAIVVAHSWNIMMWMWWYSLSARGSSRLGQSEVIESRKYISWGSRPVSCGSWDKSSAANCWFHLVVAGETEVVRGWSN